MKSRIGLIALIVLGCCAWTVYLRRWGAVRAEVSIISASVDSGSAIPRPEAHNTSGIADSSSFQHPPQPSRPPSGRCINVNTADKVRLTDLPGIGPVIAERIVGSRINEGRYTCPEDLLRVKGIGPARLQSIRDRICF